MENRIVFSTGITAAMLLLSFLFAKTRHPRLKYALWLPVGIALLLPLPESINTGGPVIRIPENSGITALWLMGAAVVAVLFIVKNLRFYLYLRRSRVKKGTWKKLTVYEVRELGSPCLFGVFPPAIYLKEINSQEKRRERFILNHEYTHYRHGDHLWAVLRCLCLILYWYHPLVWLAAGVSRRDGELACDAGTLRRIGEKNRLPYRSMLMSMAQKSSSGGRRSPIPGGGGLILLDTSTSVAAQHGEMRRRINRIG